MSVDLPLRVPQGFCNNRTHVLLSVTAEVISIQKTEPGGKGATTMKFNPIAGIFRGGERPATKLMSITPPRTGERTMLGVENLLSSIAVPEPLSLEIVGDSGGVSLLARCRDGSFVRQQVGGRYPQAQVNEVSPEDDPLRLSEGEQAYSMSLRLRGPEYLPLRTFRDDDLLDPGSDPLISVIGSLSGPGGG